MKKMNKNLKAFKKKSNKETIACFEKMKLLTSNYFKSISRLLKGSNSRIRRDVLVVIQNINIESIVSPDPNLPVDVVGVPANLAAKLMVDSFVGEFLLQVHFFFDFFYCCCFTC